LGTNAGRTVLAQKNTDGWTSIYSITASLPPDFYRALARRAGVHIYSETNDTLYVNKSYLTINADGAGTRTLRLPTHTDIYDAIDEKLLERNVREFELSLRDKETRILRLDPVD
jgi:hypothetical protein